MKVRYHLAVTVTAALLPLILFSTIGIKMLLEAERQSALQRVEEAVRALLLRVDNELSKSEYTLKLLARSQALESGDMKDFYARAQEANVNSQSWIVLFDRDGKQLINTAIPFGSVLASRAHPENGITVMESGHIRVTGLVKGPVKNRYVIALDAPVPAGGGHRYTISQAFLPDYFVQLLQKQPIPKEWLSGIVDQDGIVIARRQNPEKFVGRSASSGFLEARKKARNGVARFASLEGIEVYSVYATSDISGWSVAIGVPREYIEKTALEAVAISALGLLTALILGTLAAWFFGRRLVGSILVAEKSAAALGQGLAPEPADTGVTEVDQLHHTLSEAGRLLTQERDARRWIESELNKVLASEQEARLEAVAENAAKDEFIAMLGHELRNPLAPISTAAEILQLAQHDETRIRELSQLIGRQVRHMTELINELLDISRVTRGLVALDQVPCDMKQIVGDAIEQVRPLIDAKGHQLEMDMTQDTATVMGDQKRLLQVVGNILNNAAKYTLPGGRLYIRLQVDETNVVLDIADNGIGIEPDILPRIFDPFVQGLRTSDRAQGGLGLGLAVARGLVDLHGGTIVCQSAGLNTGSEFKLTLPRISQAVTEPEESRPGDNGNPPGLQILVVDDNVDAAETLGEYLQALGYAVTIEHDSATALVRVGDQAFDVCLLDIGLPGMDGYALARQLRQHPNTAHALLVAITGYGQEKDRQAAETAGFDLHYVKPVDIAALADMLSTFRPR